MRIACFFLPQFSVQVERQRAPSLQGKPIVIGGYYHETGHVHSVSEEAAAYGVAPDMPLRQAYSLCPSGVFLPYRAENCEEGFMQVVALAANLCPIVEPVPPVHVLLGLRYERDGLRFVREVLSSVERHTGFKMTCGVSSVRFVSMLAAEETVEADVLVVPDGDEQVFLRNLPLERLPVSDNTVRRLHLFGIARVGEILTLPAGAIEAQFGKDGRRLIEFAQGIDEVPLKPWCDESELSMEKHFDIPVEYTGELLQSIEELVAVLCSGLQSRWQCCRTTTIEVRFEDGTTLNRSLRFKQPVSSGTVMNNRIARCIEQFGDMAPVEDVRLTLKDLCAETGRQASFLDGPPRAKDQLLEAVRTLQGRYGDTVVKKVVACRNGRLPEERFAFTACDVDRA
jgi:DNA polymerase-4